MGVVSERAGIEGGDEELGGVVERGGDHRGTQHSAGPGAGPSSRRASVHGRIPPFVAYRSTAFMIEKGDRALPGRGSRAPRQRPATGYGGVVSRRVGIVQPRRSGGTADVRPILVAAAAACSAVIFARSHLVSHSARRADTPTRPRRSALVRRSRMDRGDPARGAEGASGDSL